MDEEEREAMHAGRRARAAYYHKRLRKHTREKTKREAEDSTRLTEDLSQVKLVKAHQKRKEDDEKGD